MNVPFHAIKLPNNKETQHLVVALKLFLPNLNIALFLVTSSDRKRALDFPNCFDKKVMTDYVAQVWSYRKNLNLNLYSKVFQLQRMKN